MVSACLSWTTVACVVVEQRLALDWLLRGIVVVAVGVKVVVVVGVRVEVQLRVALVVVVAEELHVFVAVVTQMCLLMAMVVVAVLHSLLLFDSLLAPLVVVVEIVQKVLSWENAFVVVAAGSVLEVDVAIVGVEHSSWPSSSFVVVGTECIVVVVDSACTVVHPLV